MNETPDIQIPKVGSLQLHFVSEESFAEHKEDVKRDFENQNKRLEWTNWILVGIVTVFFLAFLTFVLDAWKSHSETNAEYSKTLEGLRKENYEIKLHDLSTKVDQMQNKLNQKEQVSTGR